MEPLAPLPCQVHLGEQGHLRGRPRVSDGAHVMVLYAAGPAWAKASFPVAEIEIPRARLVTLGAHDVR